VQSSKLRLIFILKDRNRKLEKNFILYSNIAMIATITARKTAKKEEKI
jgi:hypothetical protein